jgi:hypothetical protein
VIVPWAKTAGVEFAAHAALVCRALKWPIDYLPWLMACIAFESAQTFSASVKNRAGSGATGLIQFMRTTAEGLGTTPDALAAMTAIEQLTYVQLYFQPYAPRVHSLADMYMSILMPKYIGDDGDAVLFSGGKPYRQNSGLDGDSDGKITKDEAATHVRAMLAKGYLPPYAAEVDV